MKHLLTCAVLLCAAPLCLAQNLDPVPPEFLATIQDDDPNPLPRGMTPAEQALPLPVPPTEHFLRGAPSGTVYCPPEYAQNEGMLIRWGSFNAILTAMAVGITSGDSDAIIYVVVSGSSEQSSATSTLSAAGADMSRVQFITRTTDSVWIRDYGPRFIFEDADRAIIDHTYNRPRPNDNLFNNYLATLWGEAQYDIPLTHGGGNFHLFANGDGFMTDLILDENSGLTEQQVKDYYQQYQNLDVTIYPGFPTSFDSTRHIDMWMLPVDDYEVIIGQYSASTGSPYTITENAAANMTSRGYAVHRTPGWQSGGTHYTYTNAVVMNDVVAMPTFSGYSAYNAQALSTFQTAFENRSVFTVDCSDIIGYAGAMHCIMMHVPEINPDDMLVSPDENLVSSGQVGGPFSPSQIVYTVRNATAAPLDYLVTKTVDWLDITNASGTIPADSTVDVTVAFNAAAEELWHGTHTDTLVFTNLTSGVGDTTRAVSLDVDAKTLQVRFPFDSDPGWTTEGLWGFGVPQGLGSHNGDPSAGYTGYNVYGYNLAGDYSTNMAEYALTSTALDCSEMTNVELRFWRWLGVERDPFDHARVKISTNGATWATIWSNPGGTLSDSAWNQMAIDISAIADNQPTVYLRWTMGTTDSSTTYPGWNIDDVELWAVGAPPAGCPEDLSGDEIIDLSDLQLLLAAYGAQPGDANWNADADFDASGTVDLADLQQLLTVYGTDCP